MKPYLAENIGSMAIVQSGLVNFSAGTTLRKLKN